MRQVLGALGGPGGSRWGGRWEGGIGMGKTCEPKAFSFQCMTKFSTNKKKKRKESVLVKKKKEIILTIGDWTMIAVKLSIRNILRNTWEILLK